MTRGNRIFVWLGGGLAVLVRIANFVPVPVPVPVLVLVLVLVLVPVLVPVLGAGVMRRSRACASSTRALQQEALQQKKLQQKRLQQKRSCSFQYGMPTAISCPHDDGHRISPTDGQFASGPVAATDDERSLANPSNAVRTR